MMMVMIILTRRGKTRVNVVYIYTFMYTGGVCTCICDSCLTSLSFLYFYLSIALSCCSQIFLCLKLVTCLGKVN